MLGGLQQAVCRRLVALILCGMLATMMPDVARADAALVAGTPAVNVAGQAILVRAAPGWDAAVTYELAADAGVTVWDVAQPAADGSLWYSVDGGFVPAETLAAATDPAALEQPVPDVSAAQTVDPSAVDTVTTETEWVEAAPVAAAGEVAAAETWVDPSLTTDGASADPSMNAWISTTGTGDITTDVGANAPVEADTEWTDPSLANATSDPASGEWVDPTVSAAPVAAASAEWIDPATGSAAAPASGEWAEPAVGDAAVAAAVDWIEPAPATAFDTAAIETARPVEVAQEAIAANEAAPDASYVELEQRGRDNDKDRDKGKDNNKDRDKVRDGNESGGGGGSASSTGSEIADFALQFEGYPYVYAGEGPNGFDCSGFTMYVIKKTLGMDITHDMFIQYEMGQQVGQGELQPGDLVFFKNTFRRGLSHNGIYIGGGEFIHAENESTGVVISDLNSDYYSSRWYGGVRLA